MLSIIEFLLNILSTLLGVALILRAWAFAIRLHPFNPISNALIQATNWLVMPIKKFIPTGNKIDWPSIFACWLVAVAYSVILLVMYSYAAPALKHIPILVLTGFISMSKWAFNVLLWSILIRVVLSWVNPTAPMMPIIMTITEPLLKPVRRIMPNLGGFDLSPLIVLVFAQIAIMVITKLTITSMNLFL